VLVISLSEECLQGENQKKWMILNSNDHFMEVYGREKLGGDVVCQLA